MVTDHLPEFLGKLSKSSSESGRHDPPCIWVKAVWGMAALILTASSVLWASHASTQNKMNQSREELVELKTSMKYIESGVAEIRQQLGIMNAKLDQVRRRQQE